MELYSCYCNSNIVIVYTDILLVIVIWVYMEYNGQWISIGIPGCFPDNNCMVEYLEYMDISSGNLPVCY